MRVIKPIARFTIFVMIIRASKACFAIPYKEQFLLWAFVHGKKKEFLLLSATCLLLFVCTAFAQVSCYNYTDHTVYDVISGRSIVVIIVSCCNWCTFL